MPNNLTNIYQTKLVPRLYAQLQAGLTSSWMEGNAVGVEYNGGRKVKLQALDLQGLGNYNRELGYPRGVVTGVKKEVEMKNDRGREFIIDAADEDETGFLVTAANIMQKFQSKYVIPEIDAIRYSSFYKQVKAEAATHVIDTGFDGKKATEELYKDIGLLQDIVGEVPLVISISRKALSEMGKDLDRVLDTTDFKNGEISLKVKSIDGNPLMPVPSARMKTEIEMLDGTTPSQEAGGYKPTGTAKDIQWIISPVTTPIAVAKIDKTRVFSPDEYQPLHAWKTDYRIYHDLWIAPEEAGNVWIRAGEIK